MDGAWSLQGRIYGVSRRGTHPAAALESSIARLQSSEALKLQSSEVLKF
jgi:hypothetical protein